MFGTQDLYHLLSDTINSQLTYAHTQLITEMAVTEGAIVQVQELSNS